MSSNALKKEDHERHAVRLHGHLHPADRGATIISFSEEGCAFRTTAQLTKGDKVALTLSILPEPLRITGEIIWSTEDYRIDTFYAFGMKFLENLSPETLKKVLDHDSLLEVQNGPLP